MANYRLVRKWLDKQSEDQRSLIGAWIDNFFYKALEWVLKKDIVVETTMVRQLKAA